MLKTNVMRILDKAKIEYTPFEYSPELTEGVKIAETLGEENKSVFKTLVTESNTKEHFVFVIPVDKTLDLKAAARSVGAKAVSMLKQKELLPLTGYIHGGCSPVGMKKKFTTVIDESAKELPFFYVSAGKVGYQVRLDPRELAEFTGADFSEITV
ncbi:MAG: Cys-tRNA(Pro) deacylase [Acutalibacteraceae bacterium]|nr:Cys-tRNA(Pro) deacylase [Clostridia bacterium]MEE1330619.1 Cys-tRNA(Pro) deacylase [Acutalibacteraceae bacterium]